MRRLKIALISSTDHKDRHAWSGTVFYVAKALQDHVGEVHSLGPASGGFIEFLAKIFQAISIYVFRKRFDFRHSRMVAKAYGRVFSKRLAGQTYDLIVAPAGVAFVAHLKTDIPVVLVLDRSLGNAFDYHSVLSNLWSFSRKQSEETDKLAMNKAALTIFSSDWAAKHALEVYKIPKEKVAVIPFGANFDEVPEKSAVFANKKYDTCKMLLVGTYWQHKGADIAVRVLDLLLKKNIRAELTITGCEAPAGFSHPQVTVTGFINKNTPEGRKRMNDLFRSHTVFILPTRFEAFGIVFCEAAAWGLVSFGTDTGGVPGVVKEGINGFLIPSEDEGEIWAHKIFSLVSDQKGFEEMAHSSRKYFEEKLNWDAWAYSFSETALVRSVLDKSA